MIQEDVVKSEILTSIKTDHLAITLEIDSLDDQQRGPSFWKFNNSLLLNSQGITFKVPMK